MATHKIKRIGDAATGMVCNLQYLARGSSGSINKPWQSSVRSTVACGTALTAGLALPALPLHGPLTFQNLSALPGSEAVSDPIGYCFSKGKILSHDWVGRSLGVRGGCFKAESSCPICDTQLTFTVSSEFPLPTTSSLSNNSLKGNSSEGKGSECLHVCPTCGGTFSFCPLELFFNTNHQEKSKKTSSKSKIGAQVASNASSDDTQSGTPWPQIAKSNNLLWKLYLQAFSSEASRRYGDNPQHWQQGAGILLPPTATAPQAPIPPNTSLVRAQPTTGGLDQADQV